MDPGACFSKVPKLFGTISGATIAFISSQRRGSKPSNFAILLVFLILKTCKKISFSKQADCNFTTCFSGPKSSRGFRETGPWSTKHSGQIRALLSHARAIWARVGIGYTISIEISKRQNGGRFKFRGV